MSAILTHAKVFFNSRFVLHSEPHDLAHFSVKLGDFLLTPIRYLMKGDKILITDSTKDVPLLFHESRSEFPDNGYPHLQTAAAVIAFATAFFLIGGVFKGILLGGIALKGLGYLSHSVRQKHALAVDHLAPFTPGRVQTIGDLNTSFDNDLLNAALESLKPTLWTQGTIDTLVIYPNEGLSIHDFPLIASLKPKKILWVQNKAAGSLKEECSEKPQLLAALEKCDRHWSSYVSACKIYGFFLHSWTAQQALDGEVSRVRRQVFIIDAKKPDVWI